MFFLFNIDNGYAKWKALHLLSAVLWGNMICNDSLMTKLGDTFENEVGDSINEGRTKDSITNLLCETQIFFML
jgi:hypothetical protein